MFLRTVVWLGILLTWLIPASVGRADLIFEFGVGGTPQSAIQIPGPGAKVPIQVFLSQTGATTILTDEGLAFAGIKVTIDDPTVAAVLNVDDIVHNPAFDDAFALTKAVNPSSAELNMGVSDILNPVFPNADGRILLGTFEFTGLSLGTTSIGVTDLTIGFDDFITGPGTPLDGLIAAGSGEAAVVPEPGSVALSLVLLGGAAAVTAVRRRRRRNAKDMTNRT
jgi:hypothetical protein